MGRRSPLHDIHRDLGASFLEVEGREIPEPFSDPEQEYRSVRENTGVLDLSSRGCLFLEGPDRVRFLQGTITNDVKQLEPGNGSHWDRRLGEIGEEG